MAGGTALSLQLGLRKSVDFDFFVPHKFNTDTLYAQLKELYSKNFSMSYENINVKKCSKS